MKQITDQQIEAWLERVCKESSIHKTLENPDSANAFKVGYLTGAVGALLNQPKSRRHYIDEIKKGSQ